MQMGFTYEIVYIASIDEAICIPPPYTGSSIPPYMLPFVTNKERWSTIFAEIVFGGELPDSDCSPVKDLVHRLPLYDDIVEQLVDLKIIHWTRVTHEAFLSAFYFFAEHGLYIRYHC
jgi:hypothetical protein